MLNENKKRAPRDEALVLLLKGLIIGKVLTLVVVGGVFSWMVRTGVFRVADYSSAQSSDITSTSAASTFDTVTNFPTGSFNYGGSTAWAPIRQLVDSQIQNAHPELQLRYVNPANGSPGSRSGIRMLLDGQLDFAQSSRPLTEEEVAIAQRKSLKLEQRPVGIDGIAAVVNHSLVDDGRNKPSA